MTTWADLKHYIEANYKVADDFGDGVVMVFNLPGGRSQIVFVGHHALMNGTESWVVVESPFGKIGNVDLPKALSLVGDMVCGGMGATKEFVTLRDAFPIENLDVNEFERPLLLVTSSADELERKLTGSDTL